MIKYCDIVMSIEYQDCIINHVCVCVYRFTIEEGVGVFTLTVERSLDAISAATTSYQLINVDTSEADFEQFIQFGVSRNFSPAHPIM